MDALATLQRLANGRLIEELGEALTATADEVVATGQPGTVTLTLKISNRGPGEPMVVIEERIARASPKRPPRGAIFYAWGGELHRQDPRQPELTFHAVEIDRETGEIREPASQDYVEREAR